MISVEVVIHTEDRTLRLDFPYPPAPGDAVRIGDRTYTVRRREWTADGVVIEVGL